MICKAVVSRLKVTQERVVGNQTIIDVVLQPDMVSLDEIVVVGYGTMKKSDVTGAIVSVRGDDIANVKSSNAAVYAPSDFMFGMASMYKGRADGEPVDFRVCRDIDAAESWVKQTV